jgi:hypothetical protein
MTHLTFSLFTGLMLAVSMAAVERRTAGERLRVAAGTFLRCGVALVAGSWLMLLIHG